VFITLDFPVILYGQFSSVSRIIYAVGPSSLLYLKRIFLLGQISETKRMATKL
jgi:uncharacterized membrane protein YuzA (DUF378 family)